MCKAKTPDYKAPPKYARERAPDNAALFEEAQNRAAERGGGTARSTIRTSQRGLMLGASTALRGSTVLG